MATAVRPIAIVLLGSLPARNGAEISLSDLFMPLYDYHVELW